MTPRNRTIKRRPGLTTDAEPACQGLLGALAGCGGPSLGRVRLTPEPNRLALQPLCGRQPIAIARPVLFRPRILSHIPTMLRVHARDLSDARDVRPTPP